VGYRDRSGIEVNWLLPPHHLEYFVLYHVPVALGGFCREQESRCLPETAGLSIGDYPAEYGIFRKSQIHARAPAKLSFTVCLECGDLGGLRTFSLARLLIGLIPLFLRKRHCPFETTPGF